MNITQEAEDYNKSLNNKCCLCGEQMDYIGDKKRVYGHNAEPIAKGHGRCCDNCNFTEVISARLNMLTKNK